MKYRPEIDGLRAIAVLAVILYHAGFEGIKGGFVGVDVFFVISGYLITSIIYSEVKDQKFSFASFYARRAGRILPPLFLVVLASIPVAYMYLLPDHLKEFSRSVISIPAFVSNIFFMKQSGYFDSAVEIKPLIHTWSLAVEEQYYLFFPVLLLVAYKLKKDWTLPFFIALGVISFLLAQFHVFTELTSFFLLPTRAWELMIGVVLAFYIMDYSDSFPIHEKITNLLGVVGLILIFYSILFITKDYPYPSIYTLLPTIGSALIILSCSEKNYTNRLLSCRYLVGIGLVSYSAYLWHQPLFAFVRYRSLSEPSGIVFSVLIVVTFLLAAITWKFVENPFRKLARSDKKKILRLYVVFSILLICLGLFAVKSKGFPGRFPGLDAFKLNDVGCEVSLQDGICLLNSKVNNNPSFAVFGDSHAIASTPMFKAIEKRHNQSYIYSRQASCAPLLDIYLLKDPIPGRLCHIANQKRFDYVKSHPTIKKVFLIARWTKYTDGNYAGKDVEYLGFSPQDKMNINVSRETFKRALFKTVESYRKIGVKVYIVTQAPQQLNNVGQLYYYMQSRELNKQEAEGLIAKKSISVTQHLNLQKYGRDLFKELSKFDNVNLINLDGTFCNLSTCLMGEPNQPYYLDKDHLSPIGAIKVSPLIFDAINE